MKRLIVAPHMDDEVLGCGGLIAKEPDGVTVVFCTAGSGTRLLERHAAQTILGYRESVHLGYEDGLLGARVVGLVTQLDQLLSRIQPDELYIPYPDLHQDHIAAYEAGMRAARASMKEGHWYVPSVFVYDVSAYSHELQPTGLTYSVIEALEPEHVAKKSAAMDAYASECQPPPSANNGWATELTAQALGLTHKLHAAEHFAPVRIIRKDNS